jgi:hypothetical protein
VQTLKARAVQPLFECAIGDLPAIADIMDYSLLLLVPSWSAQNGINPSPTCLLSFPELQLDHCLLPIHALCSYLVPGLKKSVLENNSASAESNFLGQFSAGLSGRIEKLGNLVLCWYSVVFARLEHRREEDATLSPHSSQGRILQ